MSNQNTLAVAQMLSSRICHDLISPLGAINSGLELLEESSSPEVAEIVELLTKSAALASQKLILFRFAFGQGATVSHLGDLREMLEKNLDQGKFKIHWDLSESESMTVDEIKTWSRGIVNAVLLMMEAAPYGGEIRIASSLAPDFQIILTLDTPRLLFSSEVVSALQGTIAEFNPRNIQAVLTGWLLQSIGRQWSVEQNSNRLILSTGNQ